MKTFGPTHNSHAAAILLGGLTLACLTGCGIGTLAPPTPVAGAVIQGTVFGGQQAVNGAAVQLYVAKLTGYGLVATLLIATPPTTNANGGFTVSGQCSCPVPDAPV